MENKYMRAVPAPPTVLMWLSGAKKLDLKIIEKEMKNQKYARMKSRYWVEMMKTCLQLTVEGSMLNVYPDIAHTPRRVHPIPAHPFVGQSTTFGKVVELLHSGIYNDNTGTMIGICGMGAVGKTALMQRVNNYLALTYDFHIVIWVHVSRGDDILLRVQRDILSRLGLPCYEDNIGQNKQSICSSLRRLRFVLLLDELWEKLDLQEVGLPTSHTGKVVFTTRSEKVCKQMKADEVIRVGCLTMGEAHQLLRYNLGSEEPPPDRGKKDMANSDVDSCHALPLALIFAGSCMKLEGSSMNPSRTHALLMEVHEQSRQLKPQAMLFLQLKGIYDRLPSEDSRLCLSASSTFPKYLAMRKVDLIRLWHKRKYPPSSIIDFEKGREIVQTLVDASLLESKGDYDPYAKLQPAVHDMLSWIEEDKERWSEDAIKQAPNFLEDDDVEEMQETMSTLPFKSSDSSHSREIQEVGGDPQQKGEFGERNNVLEPLYGIATTQHNEALPYSGAGKSPVETTTDDLPRATDSREAGDGSSSSHTAGLFKPDPISTFPTEPSSSTLESAMDGKYKDDGTQTMEEEATNKVSDIGQPGNVNGNVAGSVEAEAPSAKSHVGPEVDPSSKRDDEHLIHLPAEEEPSGKLVGIAVASQSSSPSNDNIIPETPPADSGESSLLPPTAAPKSKQTEICNQVLSLLHDKSVTMVALWGPRGVGKSALLKRIVTEPQVRSSFDTVIRVALPASGNIEQKMADDIAHAFGVVTKALDEQRPRIHHKLLHGRFLLLIDDLKESLKLKNIGIPLPLKHESGKIVFTTTRSDVSQYGDCARAVPVSELDDQEAWELFKKEIAKDALITSNLTVSEHAREITEEGHRRPLTIKLFAGVMKEKHASQKWQATKLQMTNEKSKEPDNLEKIYGFSLNLLPSDDRNCIMFTSLFPKDFWINEIDLIEYYIGEGFLSSKIADCTSANDVIKAGQAILKKLKAANLLEEQAQNRLIHKAVKMHDALRDINLGDRGTSADEKTKLNEEAGMGLNEAPPYEKWKTELLVEAGVGLNKAPPYDQKWKTAKRISIMANKIEDFGEAPPGCNDDLITLLLNRNHHLRGLPKNFFKFAPSLLVLDLSHCGLRTLPPSIGKLVKLRYLNLSSTKINRLPKELEKLTKLKCFKLRETTALHSIPEGILSNFVDLQLLDMFHSGFALRKENFNKIIDEMEGLKRLGIVGICVENFGSLERLSKSGALARKLAYLRMSYCVDKVSIELLSTFGTMESLRELYVSSCPSLEAITVNQEQGRSIEGIQKLTALEALYISHNNYLKNFQGTKLPEQCLENLRKLEVSYCPLVESVSWVQSLPNLINLVIESNDMMKDLFGERMAEDCFPKLRFMTLHNLSSLHNIITGDPIVFPSLEYLVISRCPKLTKLPKRKQYENLKEICGDIKWWKNLIWSNESPESSLLPLYKREVTVWD